LKHNPNEVTCPKCGRKAWKPDIAERLGKSPGKVYYYVRYRHRRDGRTRRNAIHYRVATPQEIAAYLKAKKKENES
jgi:hypothetical protein